MDLTTFLDVVDKIGTLSALILALIGGWKGWYIWKNSHDAIVNEKDERIKSIVEDRNYWREQAGKALIAAGRAVNVAQKNQEIGT